MRETQQTDARFHARRAGARCARAVAALLLVCVALPAWSASVRDVRMGRHPDFTRIVFELDEQAGYRVKRHGGNLVITVDAATKAWRLGQQGSVESVVIEAGATQSVARIRLSQQGLRLQEMILANPPRIVLDLMHTPPVAQAELPAPASQPSVKKPAPVVKRAPEPVAEPAPKPTSESPPPTKSVAQLEPDPESSLGTEFLAPLPPFVTAAEPAEPGASAPEVTPESAKPLVAPPARVRPAPARAVADTAPGLLRNPMVVGAAVAGAIVLIALVVILRRRRTIPNDVDFADMGDESEDGGMPAGDFATADAAGAKDDFFGDLDSSTSESGAAAGAEPTPPRGSSIFGDDDSMGVVSKTQGDTQMNQNLSGMQVDSSSRPSPSAAGGDIARIVQDLQARVGSLERMLEESNEARVRLERQVAAQSEELRVQRAAIARTQRALRSMSRADEDKATEPALKHADTQMKTRVNG
jgi:hypothetical protein